ncbi:hypothetical protein HAPAU_20870 [Halalkalicoccus paucihalophilus]|jgi:hypothetical protein|uniref:Phasin protein n=1 Tax=Halalkalicoccus paucihalophilus TaxID=1008153 RepID=A0A151ACP1_9EURY|nr:hypothetical protein [Halalkalicoccus paucihalophilus]KYH25415.1 hypothetical protein HAPAU_20870 [Halalkalicoccus paucihalophilus]
MTDTLMTPMFDAQRTMINQSNELFKQSLKFQHDAFETFRGTFDTQESTQRRGVEATQRAVDAYFEAIEDAGGEAGVQEIHEAVDEQFAVLLDLHEQSWDTVEQLSEENAAAYEQFVEQLESMADDSTEMAVEASQQAEEQTEIAIESAEDAVEQ